MTTLPTIQHSSSQPIAEGIITLHGISWEKFKTIEAVLDRSNGVKLSYLRGVLEIVSPIGPEHESVKSTLSLLLEAYMREKGIRFYVCGGFTIESLGTASGTPDESYAIGTPKEVPDIVIEVIVHTERAGAEIENLAALIFGIDEFEEHSVNTQSVRRHGT